MAQLLSIGSFLDDTVIYALEQVWSVRSDAAWLEFGIFFIVGALGLMALMLLYPLAKD